MCFQRFLFFCFIVLFLQMEQTFCAILGQGVRRQDTARLALEYLSPKVTSSSRRLGKATTKRLIHEVLLVGLRCFDFLTNTSELTTEIVSYSCRYNNLLFFVENVPKLICPFNSDSVAFGVWFGLV